jgi:DNA-binding LytR/AlgR family response regulator
MTLAEKERGDMKKYAAIVDDSPYDQQLLTDYINMAFEEITIHIFWNLDEFMLSPVPVYDLVVLDVMINEEKTTEKYYWIKTKTRFLMYTSNDMRLMVFCFYPKVVGFLIKTDPQEKIIEQFKRIDKEYVSVTAHLMMDGQDEEINLRDVMYIRRIGKKIEICMETGIVRNLKDITIQSLYEKFSSVFAMVNRGELVNMDYVMRMGVDDLVMIDGTVLGISRRMRKDVRERYRRRPMQ